MLQAIACRRARHYEQVEIGETMISIQKQFLFVHVPKTGGNSIQNILKDYSEDEIFVISEHQGEMDRFGVRSCENKISKHSPLSKYKRVLDATVYDSLFKFATIRNPWDRMISLYFSPHRGITKWDRTEFLQVVNKAPTLRYFVSEKSLGDTILGKLGLQHRSVRKSLDSDIDALLRFEHLSDDFRMVCERLNIPVAPLPKRNASVREHYSKYYDEELKLIVEKKFKEEIEFGNYSFESA